MLDGNKESSDKIHLVVDEDSDAIATNDIGGDAAANDSTSSSSSSYLQKKRKQKVAKSVRKHQLPLSKKPRKNKKQEPSEIEVAEKELRRKKDDAMNETILEHFCLDCKECSHSSKTFMNFMTHSMQVHKKRGFVYCCDRKFSKRCKVLEHISLHTDPESFKYNIYIVLMFARNIYLISCFFTDVTNAINRLPQSSAIKIIWNDMFRLNKDYSSATNVRKHFQNCTF